MTVDLSWVTEELAIGGCFATEHVSTLVDQRVGAVVDCRGEARDDHECLARHGIAFLHLPTRDHHPLSVAMLCEGVAFVTAHVTAGRRVLVHCQHGIGRSALLVLCVLVARGHAPLAALELAKTRRACVSPSQAQFEGWAAWLREHGAPVPAFEEYALIAYRNVRC